MNDTPSDDGPDGRSLMSQPLVHFLLLGALLFGLFTLFADTRPDPPKEIVVSVQQVELLGALWEKQWRRPPTPEELDGLIQSYIREEVLYREALAMGLDRDDTVVRRRLAQKIEFLAQDLAAQAEPTPGDLEKFYQEHAEIFEQPARISFTHVYVNLDTHGADATAVAGRWLEQLNAGVNPRQVGDRFMLQSDYRGRSQSEVSRHFGSDFSAAVFEIEPGRWTGPVRSGYGLHLVRVSDRTEPYLQPLEEVRDSVRDELISYRRREMDEQLYDRLREGYEVVIEAPEGDLSPADALSGP